MNHKMQARLVFSLSWLSILCEFNFSWHYRIINPRTWSSLLKLIGLSYDDGKSYALNSAHSELLVRLWLSFVDCLGWGFYSRNLPATKSLAWQTRVVLYGLLPQKSKSSHISPLDRKHNSGKWNSGRLVEHMSYFKSWVLRATWSQRENDSLTTRRYSLKAACLTWWAHAAVQFKTEGICTSRKILWLQSADRKLQILAWHMRTALELRRPLLWRHSPSACCALCRSCSLQDQRDNKWSRVCWYILRWILRKHWSEA